MALRRKLLIIIHSNKVSVKKKDNYFLKQNLKFLLEPSTLKPAKIEDHLIIYLHQFQSC
jgi:hypothetical protein